VEGKKGVPFVSRGVRGSCSKNKAEGGKSAMTDLRKGGKEKRMVAHCTAAVNGTQTGDNGVTAGVKQNAQWEGNTAGGSIRNALRKEREKKKGDRWERILAGGECRTQRKYNNVLDT